LRRRSPSRPRPASPSPWCASGWRRGGKARAQGRKEPGEVQLKGPWITQGYYQNEGASRAALTPDGWFRTGDIAAWDEEGYLEIKDRLKDLIKSGGEWISSVDLENALMGHPKVREAAVVAIPHPRWQERPLAVVVPRGEPPSPEELNAHLLQAGFAKWQLPDAYVFVEEIPRTSAGKFLKRALREQVQGLLWRRGVMFLEHFRLDGKAALVTGGSRGLGLEAALALQEAGARVALLARRARFWRRPRRPWERMPSIWKGTCGMRPGWRRWWRPWRRPWGP
jgi:hypothetical protein